MTISLTIRRSGDTTGGTTVDIAGGTTVDIAGEGEIDTSAEARSALNAAGADARNSVYIVGSTERNYAQMVGYFRLGARFLPNGTAYASQSNEILENPVPYDRRGSTTDTVNVTVGPAAPAVPATATLTANPAGSGGRWSPHTVTVTASGPLLPTDSVFLVHDTRPEVAAGTVGGTGTPTSFQVCIGQTAECSVGGLSQRIRGDVVTIRVKRGSAVVGEVVWNAAAPRPPRDRTPPPARRSPPPL